MRLRLSPILCAALTLAACSGEARKESGGKAGGEILPASVSDEMLPYDTVRSQAPFAPKSDGGDAGKDKNGGIAKDRQESRSKPKPAEPAE